VTRWNIYRLPEVHNGLVCILQLVLDEADTLLDMGFTNDLNFILSHLPKDRQTLLFSATVSPAIKKIARNSLDRDHLFMDCVPENESNVHEHIPQYHTVLNSAAEQIPHVLKLLAHDQLRNPKSSKSIVFLPTLKLTQLFATFVRELSEALPHGRKTSVYEIHSKLGQDQRSRASDRFRNDSSPASILVTSDVSARGVDYPGVTRVIQVGIPGSGEQYIHRVGRTGRGGKEGGRGDLVLLPWESRFLEDLSEVPIQSVRPEALQEELETLSQSWDENLPEVSAPARSQGQGYNSRSRQPATAEPYGDRLSKVETYVTEMMSSVDSDAIYETFSSMLGYYIGKQDVIKVNHQSILQGLKAWAVQAGGMEQAPSPSPGMLAKLGFKMDKPRMGGGFNRQGGGGGGSRGGNRGGSWSQGRNSAGSSAFGVRRVHTVPTPCSSKRYMTVSAIRRNASAEQDQSTDRQSTAESTKMHMDWLASIGLNDIQSKSSNPLKGARESTTIIFKETGDQYSGRSVQTRDGNFAMAYRRLSGILGRNRIKKELRLGEHHEKGSERRRRLKSERHRRRFAELVSLAPILV
jgi:ATP-dependent RNA helicase MSS116